VNSERTWASRTVLELLATVVLLGLLASIAIIGAGHLIG
jgi:Tfp pilus assembly protein FimT